MITAKLKINTDKLAAKISDVTELTLRNSEELEFLTDNQMIEIINIMDHSLSCALNEVGVSELDLVAV